MKTLILDLDGTIITTKYGEDFPIDATDWQFKKRALSTIYKFVYQNQIDNILILSNQAGIDEGFVDELEFRDKLNFVIERIHLFFETNDFEIRIEYAYSNHRSHFLRKEHDKPTEDLIMCKELISKHLRTNFEISGMIGDASGYDRNFASTDLSFAKQMGLNFYYDINDLINSEPSNLINCEPLN